MTGRRHTISILAALALIANACGASAPSVPASAALAPLPVLKSSATATPGPTAADPSVAAEPSAVESPTSPASPAPDGSSEASPPPAQPAGPPPDPAILADSIMNATSHEARAAALTEMMRALGIGVYTADGAALVRGSERTGLDFFAYDFEIDGMALALDNGVVRTLPQLTLELQEILKRLEVQFDQPITDALVAGWLHEGIAAAVNTPADDASYHLRLVRELGMRGQLPIDLAAEFDADDVAFSAPAYFLLVADLLLPFIAANEPLTGEKTGRLIASTRPVTADGHPCDVAGSAVVGKLASAAKWLVVMGDFLQKLKERVNAVKPGTILRAVVVSIESIHGVMIATTVWVDRLSSPQQDTHYRHDSPPKQLEFSLRVANFKDYPDVLVQCGWLAGLKFPKKGPIDGILVTWSDGPLLGYFAALDSEGTISCPNVGCGTTAGGGVATMRFEPDTENILARLSERQDTNKGYVRAWPMIQLSLGNTSVGFAGGDLLSPKRVYWNWAVTRHVTPHLELQVRSEVVAKEPPLGVSIVVGGIGLSWQADGADPGGGWFQGDGVLVGQTTGPKATPCGDAVLMSRPIEVRLAISELRILPASGTDQITAMIGLSQQPGADFMLIPGCPPSAGRSVPFVFLAPYIIGDRVAQGEPGPLFPVKNWTVTAPLQDEFPASSVGEIAHAEWIGTCGGICKTITTFKLFLLPD